MPIGTRRTLVMEHITRQITSRALAAGDKLPSIRQLAARLEVSASTVTEAYDILAAEGAIFARRGSGFYVANRAQPFEIAQTGPQLDRSIDPLWVARQSIDAGDEMEKPGCGWLPADWMPVGSLRRAMRSVARNDDALLTGYGRAQGGAGLRQYLARQLHDQGTNVAPQQILLTGSGSQALDLICRFLLRPGDTVLLDDPCYFNFQALLRAHQVRVISVPYRPDGPDLAQFELALRQHSPKLYLTNSALHNPSGATLSAPSAHRLLTLAEQHDLIIVEDDIFAEFDPQTAPRLSSLDGLNRVIRTGSFSKTLSASLRCGHIAARADWIEALTDLQVATQFGGPSPFVSEVLLQALTDGSYRKHMEALRQKLSRTRKEVTTKLSRLGLFPWVMPRGGFYLWCELPDGKCATSLAQMALAKGLVLAPGNVFSPEQSMGGFMRFNISQMQSKPCFDLLQALLPQCPKIAQNAKTASGPTGIDA